jgi:hypothetical protein
MTWWRKSALATGAALEALAVIAASAGSSGLALAAHLGSCAGIACGLARRAPARAAVGRLAFAMALFLPIVGALGWIVAAVARPAASAQSGAALVRTAVPGPEAARVHAARSLPPGAWPASARVAAARGRDDPGAIALLRRALANPDEDVRLIAHAVLESKHRLAYRSLHDGSRKLEAAPLERRSAVHRRLAAEHWELARTGLAEGECLVHALDSARRHARAALAGDPGCASQALLAARIELRSGDSAAAEAALERAMALGLPPEIARPYLAEAAFLERRFDRVRQWLGTEPAGAGDAALDRLRRFWS